MRTGDSIVYPIKYEIAWPIRFRTLNAKSMRNKQLFLKFKELHGMKRISILLHCKLNYKSYLNPRDLLVL